MQYGELYIGGVGLGRGYLNQPKLTAERFCPNPFSKNKNSRLYRTGDKVRLLQDGNMKFIERLDYQVKVRGYRIELGDIEMQLYSHPMVKDAAVITRGNESGNAQLLAYIVLKSNEVIQENKSILEEHNFDFSLFPLLEKTLDNPTKENLEEMVVFYTSVLERAQRMTPGK